MAFNDPNPGGLGGSGGLGGLLGSAVNKQGGTALATTDVNTSFFGDGFFEKGGGASLALGGLATLGSFYSSFQQNRLAKRTLKFQKKAFQTNLRNSTKVFNTALEDRIRARFATEGRSTADADAKIAANRL